MSPETQLSTILPFQRNNLYQIERNRLSSCFSLHQMVYLFSVGLGNRINGLVVLKLIAYSPNMLQFNQELDSYMLKVTNRFDLEVPNLKIISNKVHFETLAPGAYHLHFGKRGHYQFQTIHVDNDLVVLDDCDSNFSSSDSYLNHSNLNTSDLDSSRLESANY